MDRSKLKDIIRTLEITLDTLKAEVYSDVESYKSDEDYSSRPLDYDAVSYTHLTLPTSQLV